MHAHHPCVASYNQTRPCYLLSSMWFRSEIIWHLGKILLSTWSLSNYSQQEMSWRWASFGLPLLPIVSSEVSIQKKWSHKPNSICKLFRGFCSLPLVVRLNEILCATACQGLCSKGGLVRDSYVLSMTGIHPFCHTTSSGLRWAQIAQLKGYQKYVLYTKKTWTSKHIEFGGFGLQNHSPNTVFRGHHQKWDLIWPGFPTVSCTIDLGIYLSIYLSS